MFNPRSTRQHQQRQQQQQQQQLEIQKKHAKAERVRKLWAEFNQWLKPSRTDMERERDQLMLQTGQASTVSAKALRRRIEETHFFKAREEWQRRLRAAELKESDWDPISEAEMKAVEEALGVDDGEGYITDPSPSPPHPSPSSSHPPSRPAFTSASSAAPVLPPTENPANKSPPTSLVHPGGASSFTPQAPAAMAAPPMTSASRTTSASSSSYECVRPEEFHSDDDGSASDSEFSSFSSAISSIVSEEDEAVAPVTEFMFTQVLETTSPFVGRPLEVAKDNGPLLTRSIPVVSKSAEVAIPTAPLAPPKRPPDAKAPHPSMSRASSASSTSSASSSASGAAAAAAQKISPKTSPPVAASTSASSTSSSSSKSSSRIQYPLVGPSLSDLSDFDEVDNDAEVGGSNNKRPSPSLVAQFEAQFEVRKLQIRIQKVKEFHQLACDADIELCMNIANGRRDRALSRQEEAQLVEEHYQRTVTLRERMERERKEQVNQEKKQMREELARRKSSSSAQQQQLNGLLRQQRTVPLPADSESEDDVDDEMRKKLEKMRQEQLALQAKFSSHEPQNPQLTPRKRAGTLTSESAPTPRIAMNNKKLDEPNDVLTPRLAPRATPASAWSIRSPAPTANRNVLDHQNLSRRVDPQLELLQQDPDAVDLEADAEDDEQEEGNSGWWSSVTSTQKKKAPAPPPSQSPWNLSGVSRSPQKVQNPPKSRLGASVTSAWDDDFGAEHQADEGGVATADGEGEKEDASQDKTPVIPSAPAPSSLLMNKKQTKKRQANKKGGAAAAAKAEKADAPAPTPSTQKAQPALSPSMQKVQPVTKTAPVNVPGKSGRKMSLAESDDLSSTPKPSVLKRIQAQLANADGLNEQEDETPTTPRPAPAKKGGASQSNNPWARTIGKAASRPLVGSTFDDGVADGMDTGLGATSSGATLDQTKTGDTPSSPQVPGSWQWGTKGKNQVEPTPAGPRKNPSGRQTASSVAANGVDLESSKRKGKKPQRSLNTAPAKRTTVEEVPDDEGDELIAGSQGDNLPYNSRSILEERGIPEELEQPRIHEPKPSKPRTMFENIFQYEAVAPDPDLVHDLRDEFAWTDERIAKAVARMAQESAEMERKVNGLQLPGSAVPAGNGAGIGLNGTTTGAINGFGTSKAAVVETPHVPKQVRWQPNTLVLDDPPRSQTFASKRVPRSYEDEAFSPPTANTAFPGFSYGSNGARTNAAVPGWSAISGKNQFALSSSLPDADPEGDELARATRSLLENIHLGVSSQQRNKPGFAAV